MAKLAAEKKTRAITAQNGAMVQHRSADLFESPRRMHVIALVNQKGGSGKTTTCLNLAGALAEHGFRILVLDLDPQASFTAALDMTPLAHPQTFSHILLSDDGDLMTAVQSTSLPGINLIAGDPELRQVELALSSLEAREMRLRYALRRCMPALTASYDYVLIDCPPALGFLTANANIAATEVLLPVNLDKMGMNALHATLRSVETVRANANVGLRILGILPTQVNMRTKLDQARDEHVRSLFHDSVFATTIPNSVQVKEAIELAMPVTHYARRGAVARQYRKLADEILVREARDV